MGLAEQQRLLARLYTDASLREQFGGDPEGVAGAFGLDAIEARRLAAATGIQRFVDVLNGKRRAQLAANLPLTRQALRERFPALVESYAGRASGDAEDYVTDAVRFAAFLVAASPAPGGPDPWVADLARYEAAFLEARRPGARLLVRRFSYPVEQLARGTPGGAPRRGARLGLWLRPGRSARLRHALLGFSAFVRVRPPATGCPPRGPSATTPGRPEALR